jgi:hypothetical protein
MDSYETNYNRFMKSIIISVKVNLPLVKNTIYLCLTGF